MANDIKAYLDQVRLDNVRRLMQQRPLGASAPRSRTRNTTSGVGWNNTSWYRRNKIADTSLSTRPMSTTEWLDGLTNEVTAMTLTNMKLGHLRDDPDAASKYAIPTLKGRTLH